MHTLLEEIQRAYIKLHTKRNTILQLTNECRLCIENREPNVELLLKFLKQIENELN